MKTLQVFRRHADERGTLAKTAVSEEQRQMIAKTAETRRRLAAQRERHLLAQAKVDAIETGIRPLTKEGADEDWVGLNSRAVDWTPRCL